jgi:ketosteroid isomerase-like protein
MKRDRIGFLVIIVLLQSCANHSSAELIAQWKEEIVQAEIDFSDMAASDGIPEAFLAYAAKDAVLKRNNNLIVGWEAIKSRFEEQDQGNVQLKWSPEFVDVAESGDLGYTYGYYTMTSTDSLGNQRETKGVFHTVWKKQPNGDWRFVWD